MTRYQKNGFTLIELLVVVLIIGILSAVALPQYQTAVDKTRFNALLTLARSVKDAEEIHYMANGEYTTRFLDLDIEMPAGGEPGVSDNSRSYENGDVYSLISQGAGTSWAVYARNTKLLSGAGQTLLVFGLDRGGWKGQIACYAYNNDKRAHNLCKSLGGTVLSTACSSNGPCTAYNVLN